MSKVPAETRRNLRDALWKLAETYCPHHVDNIKKLIAAHVHSAMYYDILSLSLDIPVIPPGGSLYMYMCRALLSSQLGGPGSFLGGYMYTRRERERERERESCIWVDKTRSLNI